MGLWVFGSGDCDGQRGGAGERCRRVGSWDSKIFEGSFSGFILFAEWSEVVEPRLTSSISRPNS